MLKIHWHSFLQNCFLEMDSEGWLSTRDTNVIYFLKDLMGQYHEFLDWSTVVFSQLPEKVKWILKDIPANRFAKKQLFSQNFELNRKQQWLNHLASQVNVDPEDFTTEELQKRLVRTLYPYQNF